MTLIINSDEVDQVLNVADCMSALETAFVSEAAGIAVNHPRQRMRVPKRQTDGEPFYQANMIAGAVPDLKVAALRFDSTNVVEREVGGARRKEYLYPLRRSFGFVLLCDLESGALLAIIQDFTISPVRVAATTGVAVKRLARENATRVALLGAGNQARRAAEAVCIAKPVTQIDVFSPSRDHREAFAAEMTAALGIPVTAVSTPRPAVEAADIVLCATNSRSPVLEASWLAGGQVLTTIVNSDANARASEIGSATISRADLVVVSSKDAVLNNHQQEVLELIDEGTLGWDRVAELGEVLAGKHPGRAGANDLVYFKNNTGLGIQFAAAGELIYRRCREAGLGREIPTDWFGADVSWWLDRGFNPAP